MTLTSTRTFLRGIITATLETTEMKGRNKFAEKYTKKTRIYLSLPQIQLVELRLCIFIEKMKSLLNDTRVYEKKLKGQKTHPINKNLIKSEAKTCLRLIKKP